MSKPRGKISAYAFFVKKTADELKKKPQPLNFSELSRNCADRWKTMSEKERSKFQQMAAKDKKRYDTEMANYKGPEDAKGKKRKLAKDPNAPKRALSAFFCYLKDERPKVKETMPTHSKPTDIAREIGKRWKQEAPDVRSKYESVAAKYKAEYMKEISKYKSNKNKEGGPSTSKTPKMV